jgi:hypothetical protein
MVAIAACAACSSDGGAGANLETARTASLHIDPAGIIYIAQANWLGRVAVAP